MQLGNYLGALQNWVLMQEETDAVYCVVDLHALTVLHDPEGLIPEKTLVTPQRYLRDNDDAVYLKK